MFHNAGLCFFPHSAPPTSAGCVCRALLCTLTSCVCFVTLAHPRVFGMPSVLGCAVTASLHARARCAWAGAPALGASGCSLVRCWLAARLHPCASEDLVVHFDEVQPKQFSSAQLCPTVYYPCGLPVHHQLLELAQTHVHRVSDAIQPFQPLSSPSPALNFSQHQGLFR